MGRDNNTYAKRQREMEKRRKAEDKRARRQKKKTEIGGDGEASSEPACRDDLQDASP